MKVDCRLLVETRGELFADCVRRKDVSEDRSETSSLVRRLLMAATKVAFVRPKTNYRSRPGQDKKSTRRRLALMLPSLVGCFLLS
jgi:hypothetical protein